MVTNSDVFGCGCVGIAFLYSFFFLFFFSLVYSVGAIEIVTRIWCTMFINCFLVMFSFLYFY